MERKRVMDLPEISFIRFVGVQDGNDKLGNKNFRIENFTKLHGRVVVERSHITNAVVKDFGSLKTHRGYRTYIFSDGKIGLAYHVIRLDEYNNIQDLSNEFDEFLYKFSYNHLDTIPDDKSM